MNSIYISRSGDGHRNLATDEYVLEQYRRGNMSGVTLYFYINSNAVIIGRNQNAWRECDERRMNEDGVQLVRRHTGGGAVYHDAGNLNFSFITNEKLYDKERQTRVILDAVRSLGVEAEANGRNDLTAGGRKFSGCAYALSGVARGMHGTLLVNADMDKLARYLVPSAKKLAAKGIASVRSRVVNLSELVPVTVDEVMRAVIEAFKREYGDCEELVFDAAAEAEIERLTEKQRSWEWVVGSTPAFDYSMEERFSFGELQLRLSLRNGVVTGVKAFTDALENGLPEELEGLLTGVRFEREAIAEALEKGGARAKEIAGFVLSEANGMENSIGSITEAARVVLHTMPELALGEKRTKHMLMSFLKNRTSLELFDCGAWFYAAHREGAERTIAFRADFDAVPTRDGARHLCGHDGHAASLLALALMLEGKRIGRNVVLLFQPAEETGAGAPLCCGLFERESIDAVIGAHNIPGEPMGELLLKRGTFACASCGAEIKMQGRPTHAAYPENGLNPSADIARLALAVPAEAERLAEEYGCMTLATVVGMRTGERAFGVAASEGALWVTLRSESPEAFNKLVGYVRSYARTTPSDECTTASDERPITSVELFDVFPATVNDDELLTRIENVCREEKLPYKYEEAPFRWSEDFGHYGKHAPACFVGVGSGEGTAPLHTEGYSYPEGLAARTGEIFFKLASKL